MKKTHILFVIAISAVFVAIYISTAENVMYNNPLNKIVSLKHRDTSTKNDTYQKLSLIPVAYRKTILFNTVIAKAIYQNDSIGIEIVKPRWQNKITFKSIGPQSNNFMKALALLNEENPGDGVMKTRIESSFLLGDNTTDWNLQPVSYKIAIPAVNKKEAEMYLTIDIPNKTIRLEDKNNGLSKQQFVDAFRNNIPHQQ